MTSVDALSTSTEVWDVVSKMYSGKGNGMLVPQIEDTIHDLTQGEKSVMTYVRELRRAWADLDHLAPLGMPHSECVAVLKKWIEDTRVMKLFKGLNLAFVGRRAALMHLHLPQVEEAIAAMAQEGTRLKQMKKVEAVHKSAYVSNRQETCDCHNVEKKGIEVIII
jgi:hypothetical protein